MFIKKLKLTLLMLYIVTVLGSCKSKKVFNGTSSLDCTTFESEVVVKEQEGTDDQESAKNEDIVAHNLE